MFPGNIIDLISKVSPVLGSALGGPVGAIVGSLISSRLGIIDMNNTTQVANALAKPESQEKLKELELQLTDLQNARIMASKESPVPRIMLAVAAHLALFADIYFIEHVHTDLLKQLLLMMMVILVWDIRQVYKFYFGSSGDLPEMPFIKRK